MITNENINYLWSSLIIEELIRNNVNRFIISPGSRSTPLTVAAFRHPKAQKTFIYDERGAAFFALGNSRADQKPAVLICTSGTAVANYYPAVIEAFMDRIPLIILSADRPPELINTGANQTIDQINIFGKYVNATYYLPCPDESVSTYYLLSTINEAYNFSQDGPVHINCPFREPLAPKNEKINPEYLLSLEKWNFESKPYTSYNKDFEALSLIKKYESIFQSKNPGLIIAGRLNNDKEAEAVVNCSEKLNWPIFADITSQIKINSISPVLIHNFDLLLENKKIQEEICRLPIIHFGGQYVSKRLLTVLKNHKERYIQINLYEKRIDPNQNVTDKITISVKNSADIIADLSQPANDKFLKQLQTFEAEVNKVLEDFLTESVAVNEISSAHDISKIIKDSALFLASSMPIRDMDMFSSKGSKNISVASNRGTSGIDGNMASAIGFASALKKNLTLLIGDLAFLHDLNSLAILRNFKQTAIIVLINNRGGGIFSFLPISEFKDVFEPAFGTPHNFSFEKSAGQFGLKYFNPKTRKEFRKIYTKVSKEKNHALIEINTNRDENFLLHDMLISKIKNLSI